MRPSAALALSVHCVGTTHVPSHAAVPITDQRHVHRSTRLWKEVALRFQVIDDAGTNAQSSPFQPLSLPAIA